VKRFVLVRLVLAASAVGVWGYGYRINDASLRLVGIALLAVSLALRFLPKRWFDGGEPS
jgi:hypothetical protein